mmetsp:Transcript_28380/g.55553  ORF Transcript_28380/g.55553 Transcript_28380/m.55553 type:complete len:328 (-) Transcript_28380:509-1492(-)
MSAVATDRAVGTVAGPLRRFAPAKARAVIRAGKRGGWSCGCWGWRQSRYWCWDLHGWGNGNWRNAGEGGHAGGRGRRLCAGRTEVPSEAHTLSAFLAVSMAVAVLGTDGHITCPVGSSPVLIAAADARVRVALAMPPALDSAYRAHNTLQGRLLAELALPSGKTVTRGLLTHPRTLSIPTAYCSWDLACLPHRHCGCSRCCLPILVQYPKYVRRPLHALRVQPRDWGLTALPVPPRAACALPGKAEALATAVLRTALLLNRTVGTKPAKFAFTSSRVTIALSMIILTLRHTGNVSMLAFRPCPSFVTSAFRHPPSCGCRIKLTPSIP